MLEVVEVELEQVVPQLKQRDVEELVVVEIQYIQMHLQARDHRQELTLLLELQVQLILVVAEVVELIKVHHLDQVQMVEQVAQELL